MSVYEAGFSGFGLHRTLESFGINNIVINPASLEVAAKDWSSPWGYNGSIANGGKLLRVEASGDQFDIGVSF